MRNFHFVYSKDCPMCAYTSPFSEKTWARSDLLFTKGC